jgi:ubiquinone biosynthesis protein COQ9
MPIALRSTIISSILAMVEEKSKNLDKLALFLANVVNTWKEASQEQSNKLVNILFSQICVLDNKVIEVKSVEELRPFFWLSYE